jgi:hypothetical protein
MAAVLKRGQLLPIEIDARELRKQELLLKAFPGQIQRAAKRAVARAQDSTRKIVLRGLSRDNGIPQKVIAGSRAASANVGGLRVRGVFGSQNDKGRVRRGKVESDGAIDAKTKLWIGTRPISVFALGTPVKTKKGIRSGGKSFPGAFVATMPSGGTSVFRRKGRSRLPIEKVTYPLELTLRTQREAQQHAGERLQAELVNQLNYEVNVRGA